MSYYFAQHGEDRILKRIFKDIGTTNKHCVEFGAADGFRKSNTAYFRIKQGWTATLLDAEPLGPEVVAARITADNINTIFLEQRVPHFVDLVSIDVDGNDLWIWDALEYRPRVVVIEFNPRWPLSKSRVVPYDPDFQWDRTDYYGASALALKRLAQSKGYELVGSTRNNLIFALKGLGRAKSFRSVQRATHRKRKDPLQREWLVYR